MVLQLFTVVVALAAPEGAIASSPKKPMTIKVLTPPEGAQLSQGETVSVTWSGGYPDEHVDIYLIDVPKRTAIRDGRLLNLANDGQEDFTVPGSVPPGKYLFSVGQQGQSAAHWGYGKTFDIIAKLQSPPSAQSPAATTSANGAAAAGASSLLPFTPMQCGAGETRGAVERGDAGMSGAIKPTTPSQAFLDALTAAGSWPSPVTVPTRFTSSGGYDNAEAAGRRFNESIPIALSPGHRATKLRVTLELYPIPGIKGHPAHNDRIVLGAGGAIRSIVKSPYPGTNAKGVLDIWAPISAQITYDDTSITYAATPWPAAGPEIYWPSTPASARALLDALTPPLTSVDVAVFDGTAVGRLFVEWCSAPQAAGDGGAANIAPSDSEQLAAQGVSPRLVNGVLETGRVYSPGEPAPDDHDADLLNLRQIEALGASGDMTED